MPEGYTEKPLFPLLEEISKKRTGKTPVESLLSNKDFMDAGDLTKEDIYPTTQEQIIPTQVGRATIPIVYGGWPLYPYKMVEIRRQALEKAAMLKELKKSEEKYFPDVKIHEAWEPYREQLTQSAQNEVLGLWDEANKKGRAFELTDPTTEFGKRLTTLQNYYNTLSDNSTFLGELLKKKDEFDKGAGRDLTKEQWLMLDKLRRGKWSKEEMRDKFPNAIATLKAMIGQTELLKVNVYNNIEPDITQAILTEEKIKGVLSLEAKDKIIARVAKKWMDEGRLAEQIEILIHNKSEHFMDIYGGDFLENPVKMEDARKKLMKEVKNHYAIQETAATFPSTEGGLTFSFGGASTPKYTFTPVKDFTKIAPQMKSLGEKPEETELISITKYGAENDPVSLGIDETEKIIPQYFAYNKTKKLWSVWGEKLTTEPIIDRETGAPEIDPVTGEARFTVKGKSFGSIPLVTPGFTEKMAGKFFDPKKPNTVDNLLRGIKPDLFKETTETKEEYTNITTLKDSTGKTFKAGTKNNKWYNTETGKEIK